MKKYLRCFLTPVLAMTIMVGGTLPVAGNAGFVSASVEAAGVKLAAPTGIKGKGNSNSVNLTWNVVAGASSYNVYIYNINKKVFQKYKTVTGNSCAVTGLKSNRKYYFIVSALKKDGGDYVEGARSARVAVSTTQESTALAVGTSRYLGEISKGKPNGQGKIVYINGNWYEGGFKAGIRSGNGTLYNASSKRWYEGKFNNDKANGEGVIYYSNGDWYEGMFASDKFEGQGTYHFADGEEWVGKWKKGEWIGGKKYTDTKEGLKYNSDSYNSSTGVKAFTYPNGDKYIGFADYIGTTPDVKGRFVYANGDWYVGEIKTGKKSGDGMFYHSNGERYVGKFKDDKANGLGTYYYVDGKKYVGEFKNDLQNGQGILYLETGEKWVGTFKNDKFVSGVKYDMEGNAVDYNKK